MQMVMQMSSSTQPREKTQDVLMTRVDSSSSSSSISNTKGLSHLTVNIIRMSFLDEQTVWGLCIPTFMTAKTQFNGEGKGKTGY